MTVERRPGSSLGRPAIDWQEAFLFYASLPAEQRDYQTVAEKFEVSRRTVERHGSRDRWKEQARELDRGSLRAAAERLRDERADKLVDTEKLVEATCVTYAQQLLNGQVKVTPPHLVQLFGLRERIWSLQDDETVGQPEQVTEQTDSLDRTERKLQVLRALGDAGVLDRLLHPDHDDAQPTDGGRDERDGDDHDQDGRHQLR